MSCRLVESEAGNFSLFRSKQNVLTNHLQGRAQNRTADNRSESGWVGDWGSTDFHADLGKYTQCLSLAGGPEPLNPERKNCDPKLDFWCSGPKPAPPFGCDRTVLAPELRCDIRTC